MIKLKERLERDLRFSDRVKEFDIAQNILLKEQITSDELTTIKITMTSLIQEIVNLREELRRADILHDSFEGKSKELIRVAKLFDQ